MLFSAPVQSFGQITRNRLGGVTQAMPR